MVDRRTVLLDGAISVLGERGVRAVTHRAVDAAAGLPAGSTSNVFRARDDLFDALVIRIADRERRVWEEDAHGLIPTTPGELARVLTTLARTMTTTHRTVVLARYAILVEAGSQPRLRAQLRATGAQVSAWFLAWLRLLGSDDPGQHAHLIMNYWSGLVLHELAMPDPAFDPTPHLERLVGALLPAGVLAGSTEHEEGRP